MIKHRDMLRVQVVGNKVKRVSWGKKCSFFGKFDMLCFFKKPVLRFALSPYYRRSCKSRTLVKRTKLERNKNDYLNACK